jgi:hypothetical protein
MFIGDPPVAVDALRAPVMKPSMIAMVLSPNGARTNTDHARFFFPMSTTAKIKPPPTTAKGSMRLLLLEGAAVAVFGRIWPAVVNALVSVDQMLALPVLLAAGVVDPAGVIVDVAMPGPQGGAAEH